MVSRGYRVLILALAFLAATLVGWHLWPGNPGGIPRSAAMGEVSSRVHEGLGYVLYVPTTISADRPNTLLVAFYGMGGNAEQFAESLSSMAERNGWLLLVPRFTYGDYKQIDAVRADDREQLPHLRTLLEVLPHETGLQIRDRVLLYGFSRGAQASHRFALMYNDKVLAAAAMAAGSYTLPVSRAPSVGTDPVLRYPLGVGDINSYCGEQFDAEDVKKVAFWVGVGELDTNSDEVPRSWDRFLGTNRVDRARSFAAGMKSVVGATVQLDIIPQLGHSESEESRSRAEGFLRQVEATYTARD